MCHNGNICWVSVVSLGRSILGPLLTPSMGLCDDAVGVFDANNALFFWPARSQDVLINDTLIALL